MEVGLCDRFPALTPLSLRREKAREVFILIGRYNAYAKRQKRSGGKQETMIRRPAGDDWF